MNLPSGSQRDRRSCWRREFECRVAPRLWTLDFRLPGSWSSNSGGGSPPPGRGTPAARRPGAQAQWRPNPELLSGRHPIGETGAIGRSWRVARGGWGLGRWAVGGGGGGWAALAAGGGNGLDRARKAWPRPEGWRLRIERGLEAGVAGSGGGVPTGSGAAWMRSRTAAEAWLLRPTDWFLDVSLVRKGPRLVGAAGEWPYLSQKSK